jgi:hypothetical protein
VEVDESDEASGCRGTGDAILHCDCCLWLISLIMTVGVVFPVRIRCVISVVCKVRPGYDIYFMHITNVTIEAERTFHLQQAENRTFL